MRLWDVLYPSKCVFCGHLLESTGTGACPRCAGRLPYVTEPVCERCGKPIASERDGLCTDCSRRQRPSLSAGLALWVYQDDTRKAMVGFKYGGFQRDALYFADVLAERGHERIFQWDPDVLVPIPIHRKRARYRGFNQAELLAEALGERLQLPTERLLTRVRATTALKSLTPGERRRSLMQAFAVDESVFDPARHRRVVLIDDIYTTGATMEACAGLLREAGAEAVYSACLCIGSER